MTKIEPEISTSVGRKPMVSEAGRTTLNPTTSKVLNDEY